MAAAGVWGVISSADSASVHPGGIVRRCPCLPKAKEGHVRVNLSLLLELQVLSSRICMAHGEWKSALL